MLFVVAAASAAAPAPPRWLSPRTLSSAGADAVIPDVAVDPKGNAIVVWAQSKQSSWTVESVERPPGGPWEGPRVLSKAASQVASPQLAVAGTRVAAVWDRFDGKNLIVQAASRDPATRVWSSPVALSTSGRDAQTPRVAVNSRGDTVAVWASVGFQGWGIQAAFKTATGAWGPPEQLESGQVGTSAPDVTLDETGRAVAVWAATAGTGWRVHSSARSVAGTWSKAVAVSGPDATGAITPQLALEGTGDVLAVWSRAVGTVVSVESSTFSGAQGVWSAPAKPFSVQGDALAPSVAVNRRGDGVIVWTSSNSSGLAVMASIRRPGQVWGAPTPLSKAAGGPLTPHVAVDSHGDAVAVWTRSTGGVSRVQASSRLAPGVAWTAQRTLSGAGADALTPQVALDDGGDGVVAWARYDGRSFVTQGDGYDASGPALGKLTIPVSGSVGQRVTFSVTPKDVWTTIGTIRWTFGDGTAGSGRATGHVYTRAGRYTARVTVTDAFGHVTTVRRAVVIAA